MVDDDYSSEGRGFAGRSFYHQTRRKSQYTHGDCANGCIEFALRPGDDHDVGTFATEEACCAQTEALRSPSNYCSLSPVSNTMLLIVKAEDKRKTIPSLPPEIDCL